ncbi:MAG: hypothetical protein Q9183_002095 [Haloplaca sp. 2 TL-2023]
MPLGRPSLSQDDSSAPSLHRSNAQRRRRHRRQTHSVPPAPPDAVEPTAPEHDDETVADTAGSDSDANDINNENKPPEDQKLMNLLYRIAENQAKKDGFVHRGVHCNGCAMMPITGIRYRCINCHDYDLCETCEAQQLHDKTHLFNKIRIPAPFLGNPRQPSPVCYPGKPDRAARTLTSHLKFELYQKTGIQDKQLDAYWEQFQCLAASDYPADPHGFRIAIDRRAFNQCFIPNSTIRDPAPNLLYDRMFAFYDTNDDDLIGFEEFLTGIASINKRDSKQDEQAFRAKIFRAYDVDNDGFVDRKDFLRMFRGYQTLTMELTKQVVSSMEDEFFEEEDARELIAGSQPLSSIFAGPIPLGQPSLGRTGKSSDRHGDDVVSDGQGVLREEDSNPGPERDNDFPSSDRDTRLMDDAERQVFGDNWWIRFDQYRRKNITERWDHAESLADDLLTINQNVAALHRLKEPSDFINSDGRLLYSCASQELIGEHWWARTRIRRRVIDEWRRTQQFCLDNDSMTPRRTGRFGDGVYLAPEILEAEDLYSMRIAILDRMASLGTSKEFRAEAISAIEEQWPKYPNVPETVDRIERWIRNKCRWYEMALNLADYQDERIVAAASVVGMYLYKVEFHDQSANSHTHEANPVCNGSRSSSGTASDAITDTTKRHDSPSIIPEPSSNAQHEGPQASPLNLEFETNTVRGIIHQVTEDAMNELLDPMFRLRESLALEEQRTRALRAQYRQELEDYIRLHSGLEALFKGFLGAYQERWYRMSRVSEFESSRTLHSQAIRFCLLALSTEENRSEQVDVAMVRGKQAEAREASDHGVDGNPSENPRTQYPSMAFELHEAVTTFNSSDASTEDATKQKPLDSLLAEAGYRIATPPQMSDESPDELNSSPRVWVAHPLKRSIPDPTLPHNRPNDTFTSDAQSSDPEEPSDEEILALNGDPLDWTSPSTQSDSHPKTQSKLLETDILFFIILKVIEEDDLSRGGPGRLNLQDFENVMTGDKGQGLGFIGSWIDMCAF